MVYVLLGTGFEETEAIAPVDLLRRAGVAVQTVGLNGKTIYGSHQIGIAADITIDEMELSAMDMLMLPGGLGGVASIKGCQKAMEAIGYAHENRKWLAAICAAPTILAGLGLLDGKHAVCYPGCEDEMPTAILSNQATCRDGHIITGTSAGCAIPFGLALIEALKGNAEANRIAEQIVIR